MRRCARARLCRARTARDAMSTRPAAKPGAAARSQRCSWADAASRAAPSVLLRLALSAAKMSSAAAPHRASVRHVSTGMQPFQPWGEAATAAQVAAAKALGMCASRAARPAESGDVAARGTHPRPAWAARRARRGTWRRVGAAKLGGGQERGESRPTQAASDAGSRRRGGARGEAAARHAAATRQQQRREREQRCPC